MPYETISKEERKEAYLKLMNIFPSASQLARELGIENRATVSHWRRRGVPIDYIMVIDELGFAAKEDLAPSVVDWDIMKNTYAESISAKLEIIAMNGNLQTSLRETLRPLIREELTKLLEEREVL